MIRECGPTDTEKMFEIINEAATVYQGVIPDDRYHSPYMAMDELKQELKRMTFYGWEEDGELVGVMAIEPVKDTCLIRHAYILPRYQRHGIGEQLLQHAESLVTTPRLLVGTWADAWWAIKFYERHGFTLLSDKDELLAKYWDIPRRQIETSIVLGIDTGKDRDCPANTA